LFGSRPLGRGPRAAFFRKRSSRARLRRWENQRVLSSYNIKSFFAAAKTAEHCILYIHSARIWESQISPQTVAVLSSTIENRIPLIPVRLAIHSAKAK